ncbi:MAG: zinc ABC transporter substrate-binding protein [Eubacteriales bacterium]|nr:zinc ABC transporter substrate-binding protein [Eubacteriales bacterium]
MKLIKWLCLACALCLCLSVHVGFAQAKPKVITTTTMLYDLVRVIAGDTVELEGLMGVGLDPHIYQASAGDVRKLQQADIIAMHGMHLEGRLGKVLENLERMNKTIISLENGIDSSQLLHDAENPNVVDPHIWFDVTLWMQAAQYVTQELSKVMPEHSALYAKNAEKYLQELTALDQMVREQIQSIPQKSRVLITAHDAFSYFGRAYGIEVKGVQGISTDAESSTSAISSLANFIVESKVKAIFIETSTGDKSIRALQEAVKSQGFETQIGGALLSDSLGNEEDSLFSYIAMVKYNTETIVNALQ